MRSRSTRSTTLPAVANPRRSVAWAVACLTAVFTVSICMVQTARAGTHSASDITGPDLAAASQCPWMACAEVLSAVAAGAKIQKVPTNLTPGLADAAADVYPAIMGCVVPASAVSTAPPCVDNPAATSKRMVLIGDSHAEMWSPAIADIAQANGYSLLFLSKLQCLLPMVPFWNPLTSTPNTQCTAWKKWAIARIQQFNPNIVIATTEDYLSYASSGLQMSQKQYASGLTTTLKDVAGPGRRVVLLGDIPYLSQTGPICLAAHEGSAQSCATPTAGAVSQANQAAERSAAAKGDATFINVIPWFCTRKVCPAIIGTTDVYSDDTHVTATYGKQLEGVVAESLGLQAP